MSAATSIARFREGVRAFFLRQSRGWIIFEATLLVLIIGFIDYVTGYEVTIFPFYSIPVLLALWLAGTEAAVLICLFGAIAAWCADVAAGHHYSREWLRLWDSIVRLIFLYLVLLAGSNVRRQRDANRARIELLERSRELEQQIINISELEQQRIGRDLHDSLGQHLVAIRLAADSLKDELAPATPRAATAVGQFAELLRDAVNLTRGLARGLSPVDPDEGGLESALQQLVSDVSRLSGVRCVFFPDGGNRVLQNSAAVHVFRIAQEAINNAVKHAKATDILVTLATSDAAGSGAVHLTVRDNGVGFDPATHSADPGMGFKIMKYRSSVMGGSLSIRPGEPTGTVVEFTTPSEVDSPAASPATAQHP